MDWKGIKVTVRLSVVNRVVSGQRKKRERSIFHLKALIFTSLFLSGYSDNRPNRICIDNEGAERGS